MEYRKEIDGLRALAVLPVMLFHAGMETFSGGFVGVDVFFVISGYLITSIILTEIENDTFTILNFYERRARRILPALFFIMLVSIPFAWTYIPPDELKDYYQSLAAVSLFASNILFWLESGYFDTAAELKPLLHTWSLAVEEQYYVIYPILLITCWRFGKVVVLVILSIIAISSLLLAQQWSINQSSANFFLLPTRFWELLIGSFAAFIFTYNKKFYWLINLPPLNREILSITGLSLILFSVFQFNERTPFPGIYALTPTIGTFLIIIFGKTGTLTNKILSNKLLVGIGLISYSAYLWHQPILAFTRMIMLDEPGYSIIVTMLLLTIALSYLSWRFVEKPFRNKSLISRKSVFISALLGSTLFFLTGLLGHKGTSFLFAGVADQKESIVHLRHLSNERQSLIRFDECHFNMRSNTDIDEFVDNWDCWKEFDSEELDRITVVIAGDSHAADIAVAMKLNGLLPLQIGGSGCSLNPDFMFDYCHEIFSALYDRVQSNSYFKYIILTNRFEKDDLSKSSIEKTIKYWKKFGLKIFFLTAMPEFTSFKKAVIRGVEIEPDFELADYSSTSELKTQLSKHGITMINKKDIFCALTNECSYQDSEGNLLLIDYSHFSRLGATKFGKALISSGILNDILNDNSL